MGAIKEHYHDEIEKGQRAAALEGRTPDLCCGKYEEPRVCKNCAFFFDEPPCPESKGENDTCEYFSLR